MTENERKFLFSFLPQEQLKGSKEYYIMGEETFGNLDVVKILKSFDV